MEKVYIRTKQFMFEDGEKIECGVVIDSDTWQIGGMPDTLPEELEDALAECGISMEGSEAIEWNPDNVNIDEARRRLKEKGFELVYNEPDFVKEFKRRFNGDLEDLYDYGTLIEFSQKIKDLTE